ncbi:hypothetical protein BC941DRAFT_429722 [Chlamydoabsidia padenii]|nr:hypothetical protein BC941DRAFT_429722 [Chlamydoabsidia padenii]
MEDTTKSVPFTVNDATPAPQPVQGSSSSLPEEDPITESHQPNLLWSKPGNEQEVMPSSSEKEMEAADDAAVAQEKAWIAQQQKHSSSNSPKHSSTKSPKSHHQTSPKSHAVDIVNQVKAAAAINKAASIAHLLSHQKRNAYRHIHKNRAKFAKRNLL